MLRHSAEETWRGLIVCTWLNLNLIVRARPIYGLHVIIRQYWLMCIDKETFAFFEISMQRKIFWATYNNSTPREVYFFRALLLLFIVKPPSSVTYHRIYSSSVDDFNDLST